MSDLNRWEGIGRLGRDPDVRALPNGEAVASFSVACGESWTDKQTGERKQKAEWINCTAFGKLAEICGQYLTKGKQVYASGKMHTRTYEKDGQKHYITEVVLDQMQILGSRQESSQPAAPSHAPVANCPQQGQGNAAEFEDDPDPIPF